MLNLKSREPEPRRAPPKMNGHAHKPKAEAPPWEDSADDRALDAKYRPSTFDDIIGQDAVVASLKHALGSKHHAFLFTGPSGTGKTTLSRIVAGHFGLALHEIMEIDAATKTGVENMRSVLDLLQYKSLSSAGGRRFVIVDEAHALSASAWKSLLKSIEEPPPHVYWAFCTTEGDKIPDTVRTRCISYHLKDVDSDLLHEHLADIAKKEGMEVPDELIGLAARHARGSVRLAITYLIKVAGAKSKADAARLLETGVGNEEQAIALARMVCNGKNWNWAEAMRICKALDGESAEGIRLVVTNYAAKALLDAKQPDRLLAVLSAFQGPYNPSEKFGPLLLSLGALT